MSKVVQATCPGCKSLLRIPSAMLAQPVRCSKCGIVMQTRQPYTPPPPPGTPPPLPVEKPAASTPPPLTQRSPAKPTSPFAFDESDASVTPVRPRRRSRSSGWLAALAALVILGLTGAMVVGVYTRVIKPRQEAAQAEQDDDPTANVPTKVPKPERKPSDAGGPATFPRRALVISVHNYLYANPIPDGPKDSPNLDRLIGSLNRGLRIPLGQIVHLSDAAKKDPLPPMKDVIQQAVTTFLKTTRAQDRIVLVFRGHTHVLGDKAYLVPLEGEKDAADTLLPLDWVFQQLAACPARQKVFVLDGNRVNASQGEERPASGPMAAVFEAALKAPPAGVQVWSACAAEQQSHEFEESSLGLFLDSVRLGLTPEKNQRGPLDGKIPKADDLLPVEALHEFVNERMAAQTERRKVAKQVAFLAGKVAAEGAAYDRAEGAAEVPALPVINAGDVTLVNAILGEISLPAMKGGELAGQDVSAMLLPPFPADGLKAYAAGELPADSKLGKAIREARIALWGVATSKPPADIAEAVTAFRAKLGVDLSIMRGSYGMPGSGNAAETVFKTRVYNDSRLMAPLLGRVEDAVEKLKDVGDEVKAAPKRWQAHYHYLLARAQAQLAYLEEYQKLLGDMRKELPEHDPKVHSGFRMASKEKAGDVQGKKLEKAARKLYGEVAKDHPKTPWEVLAKRDRLTTLGLEWKAY